MKFVALISGGKDSIFNIIQCISYGHELVCVANLHPPAHNENKELDSFMFQTVGVEITDYIAQCLEVPIVKREIQGKSINQELYYEKNEESKLIDEVEELFQLVQDVKVQLLCTNHFQAQFPEVQAVASGAIFSNYQRLRVENVCQRLGLVSIAYLWLRDQSELLKEMIETQMDARIIKICSMGLKQQHLGKSIASLYDYFIKLRDQFQFNVCGEGGEYESAVFDCPIFKKKRIHIVNSDYVYHVKSEIGPVAYLRLYELELQDKPEELIKEHSEIMVLLRESRIFIDKENENDRMKEFIVEKTKVQQKRETEEKKENNYFVRANEECVVTRYLNITDFGVFNTQEKQLTQAEEVTVLFTKINEILAKENMTLKQNAVAVSLFITDMSKFPELNAAYMKFFGLKPPVRACVALPHKPVKFQVQASILLFDTKILEEKRTNLHVQSISQWAPSNIGPYSQGNLVNGHIFIAGQIGLIPDHMVLPSTFHWQRSYIIQNFHAILENLSKKSISNSSINGVLYIDKLVNIGQFKEEIEKDAKELPLIVLRCEKLPRSCLLELELYSNSNKINGLRQEVNEDVKQVYQKIINDDMATKYVKIINQISVSDSNFEEIIEKQCHILMKRLSEEQLLNKILKIDIFQPIGIEFNTNENYIRDLIQAEITKIDAKYDVITSTIPVYEAFILAFGNTHTSDSIVWTATYIQA